jgi:L-gulonate 5-dehydrogenase
MKALVTTSPRTMELRVVAPPPAPSPGEVRIAVDAVGICGSDYHIYKGEHPLNRFPQVQGHEISGVVTELGADCSTRLAPGTRVAVEPLLSCGACYPCRLGRYNCCTRLEILGLQLPGGLQEELVIPERLAHDAGDLPAEIAAFVEPMSIGLQSVTRAEIGPADRVLIVGAGPIGQATLLCARARGAKVAISDLIVDRLELARALGADAIVPAGAEMAASVADWTNGEGASVVVDATGAEGVIEAAEEMVADAGRILLIGISKRRFSLTVGTMIRKELSVVASRNSAGIFADAVQLVRDHQGEVATLITHRIGLDEVQDTIELALAEPYMVEKAVVRL